MKIGSDKTTPPLPKPEGSPVRVAGRAIAAAVADARVTRDEYNQLANLTKELDPLDPQFSLAKEYLGQVVEDVRARFAKRDASFVNILKSFVTGPKAADYVVMPEQVVHEAAQNTIAALPNLLNLYGLVQGPNPRQGATGMSELGSELSQLYRTFVGALPNVADPIGPLLNRILADKGVYTPEQRAAREAKFAPAFGEALGGYLAQLTGGLDKVVSARDPNKYSAKWTTARWVKEDKEKVQVAFNRAIAGLDGPVEDPLAVVSAMLAQLRATKAASVYRGHTAAVVDRENDSMIRMLAQKFAGRAGVFPQAGQLPADLEEVVNEAHSRAHVEVLARMEEGALPLDAGPKELAPVLASYAEVIERALQRLPNGEGVTKLDPAVLKALPAPKYDDAALQAALDGVGLVGPTMGQTVVEAALRWFNPESSGVLSPETLMAVAANTSERLEDGRPTVGVYSGSPPSYNRNTMAEVVLTANKYRPADKQVTLKAMEEELTKCNGGGHYRQKDLIRIFEGIAAKMDQPPK